MQTAPLFWLPGIALLPLLGAVTLGLFGGRWPRRAVSAVAVGAAAGAFVLTVLATAAFVRAGVPLEAEPWTWMAAGSVDIPLGFRFDALTASLLLVVTGVGALIHVYSTEYMEDDPGHARYFAYLNLFVGAMSVLVLGASLPVTFIGWEGVGLASYLLIGFWFTDTDKAIAGKKAFIVNRVGDAGFLLGTFLFFDLFGTVDYLELTGVLRDYQAPELGGLTAACLLVFLGACGKSAQLPLHIWLPDAMAGPTPVSALIHAATMVTSGVYLVARLGPAFDLAPEAGYVVAAVGGTTALFAATVGLAQHDIKRVLAYSTVSQLGYMFLAAGLGAYGVAMFHVVTHAFFKACLFLGAGAVIHALHGEQDLRRMGDLLRRLPVVSATFALATLAIIGAPLFSGFFSKDAILAHAFQAGVGWWLLGLGAAGLTAFYMTRLFALAFLGPFRFCDPDGTPGSVHPPGLSMKVPLVVLAFLSVIGGWISIPHLIADVLPGHPAAEWFVHRLEPVTGGRALTLSAGTELMLTAAVSAVSLVAAGFAFALYRRGPSEMLARLTARGVGRLAHTLVYGRWFVDELVQIALVGPLRVLSSLLAVVVDPWIIDRAGVQGPGYLALGAGRILSRLQTGNVQSYALVFALGVAVVLLWASG